MIAIGAASIAASFLVGIQTAGDVKPIALIEAGGSAATGDIDGNGVVDLLDALAILEIAQGYREPTPKQLLADPSGNGALTVEDAIRLLSTLSLR